MADERDEKIRILIDTVAKLKGIQDTQKGFEKLRQIGERVSRIGTQLTGFLTVPIAGITALLVKNEQLAASLQPVKDAFAKVINDLAVGLIPAIKDLTPAILNIVKGISDLVAKFNGLSTEQKENILKWVGLAALLGPLIFGIGQLISFVGSLGWAFNGALAPILAVGAALFALVTLVQMDEFKQVVALLAGNTVASLTGNDKTKGALATKKTYEALGGGSAGGSATGDFVRNMFGVNAKTVVNPAPTFVVNYSPALSTASAQEVEKQLAPIISDILRQRQGR